jgi:hypothetical protein
MATQKMTTEGAAFGSRCVELSLVYVGKEWPNEAGSIAEP